MGFLDRCEQGHFAKENPDGKEDSPKPSPPKQLAPIVGGLRVSPTTWQGSDDSQPASSGVPLRLSPPPLIMRLGEGEYRSPLPGRFPTDPGRMPAPTMGGSLPIMPVPPPQIVHGISHSPLNRRPHSTGLSAFDCAPLAASERSPKLAALHRRESIEPASTASSRVTTEDVSKSVHAQQPLHDGLSRPSNRFARGEAADVQDQPNGPVPALRRSSSVTSMRSNMASGTPASSPRKETGPTLNAREHGLEQLGRALDGHIRQETADAHGAAELVAARRPSRTTNMASGTPSSSPRAGAGQQGQANAAANTLEQLSRALDPRRLSASPVNKEHVDTRVQVPADARGRRPADMQEAGGSSGGPMPVLRRSSSMTSMRSNMASGTPASSPRQVAAS